ncbi:MAG: SDR family NAD(P)-dependent oxidoreductase [Rickettsiales bacterium]|nr:SDR family NAD(P)-dependent oxidoreductase [Rickettsiales bacterium]
MSKNFYEGKNIWIIGGTTGIGLALALQLSKLAKNVVVSGRSNFESSAPNLSFIRLDVTKLEEVESALTQIKSRLNHLDILIFCAGIYEPMGLKNFNLQKSREILDVNFGGFLNVIENLNLLQRELKLGHLAVVSSIASYFGMPNSLCYGASKAALSNIVESLFYELKNQVKVQLINPGFVKTRLTDQNNFKMPFLISNQEAAEIILKNLPREKFEISFPAAFSRPMRLIKILPYKARFWVLKLLKIT